MPITLPAWWDTLHDGDLRVFGMLQVDIARHGQIQASSTVLQRTKEELKAFLSTILTIYGGRLLNWAGDGGSFLFLLSAADAMDRMVIGALHVLHDLSFFNLSGLNLLGQDLKLRISCHRGELVFSHDPGTIHGTVLNLFLKNERALGLEDRVTLTDSVFLQLASSNLRQHFSLDEKRAWRISEGDEKRLYVSNYISRATLARDRRSNAEVAYDLNEVEVTLDQTLQLYHLRFHKIIRNCSQSPISSVLYHVLANVFPDDPKRSYAYYLANPVSWEELGLCAWDGDGPLDIKLVNDHAARKDYLISFAEKKVERPILEDESRELWYSFQISTNKWGPYIGRPISFPTEKCVVKIKVPRGSGIHVGGYELTPFRPRRSMARKIRSKVTGDSVTFTWEESSALVLGNTYQINWSPIGDENFGVGGEPTLDHRLSQQE